MHIVVVNVLGLLCRRSSDEGGHWNHNGEDFIIQDLPAFADVEDDEFHEAFRVHLKAYCHSLPARNIDKSATRIVPTLIIMFLAV